MIAIVLVLTAVFLPVAFLGGLVGEMYRQFAITIAVSVTISGFVALTLTPALCALLLKTGEVEPRGLLARFDDGFERLTHRYTHGVQWVLRHGAIAAIAIVAMVGATWRARTRDADRACADRGPGLCPRDRGAAAGGVAAAHEDGDRATRQGRV